MKVCKIPMAGNQSYPDVIVDVWWDCRYRQAMVMIPGLTVSALKNIDPTPL